jgi:hypothetical protein
MAITRLERMLAAAKKLPSDMSSLFDDLFVHAKSDEKVCAERNISRQQLDQQRDQLMRSLRAASS